MKKIYIVLAVVALVLVLLLMACVGTYNSMVAAEEKVDTEWAKVESQYQRRSDLIPNLVATVKGYAVHEQETLDAVVSARAKATQTSISADNLTPENMAAFQSAQGELSSALSRLLVTVEKYPDLKANANFLELQSQLEGTENRISTERNRYSEAVRAYNVMIRRFPASIIASWGGFEKKPLFTATEGAEKAPVVNF